MEDDERDANGKSNYDCGLGSCKPSCFQKFNNPVAALVFLCWFALVQGKEMTIEFIKPFIVLVFDE